jgi:hypothetical protein
MSVHDLQHVFHRAPFQPFSLHLADGHRIDVPHPDFVAIVGDGLSAIVTSPHRPGSSYLDLLLVTRIEVPAQQQTR